MGIKFEPIDAKDNLPGGVISIDGWEPRNLHNVDVMAKAESEYLNELLDLQKRIKEKYEPDLAENKPIDGQPKDWELIELLYKGRESLLKKGTGNLWYN